MLSEIADAVSFIVLESNENSSIGSIEKVVLHKDLIFISDEQNTEAIYCFSITGAFQFKIARKGRGPGEYLDIEDFDIDRENDLVLIYDRSSGAILEYDFDGVFIARYVSGLVFDSFKHISDNTLIAYSAYSTNSRLKPNPNSLIFTYNYRNPVEFKTYMKYTEEFGLFQKIVTLIGYISQTDELVYFYDYYSNSIYSFRDDSLKQLWTFDYGEKNIPKSFWKDSDLVSLRKGIATGTFAGGLENFQVIGKWVFGIYPYERTMKTIIYNVETQKVFHLSDVVINDIHPEFPNKVGFPIVLVPPFLSDGSNLISVIEPTWVQRLIQQDNPMVFIPDELKNLDINSNPILELIKLK